MKNLLAGVPGRIEDDPISPFTKSFVPGYVSRCEEYASQDRGAVFGNLVQRGEVVFGDDEDVDRRLRIDVLEGQDFSVLEHDPGGDLFGDDLAEDTVFHAVLFS